MKDTHKHTRKLNENVSTITDAFENQKTVTLCEHRVETAPHLLLMIKKDICDRRNASLKLPCVVFVFFICLMGWPLLPNALRPFKIYCAPPNVGITRI